jgi:UDP-N-acetylmuramate dehydrogenase
MKIDQAIRESEWTGHTLAELSHIRVGGSARQILAPSSNEALYVILSHLDPTDYRFVGGGSNTLLPDEYRGTIISGHRLPSQISLHGEMVTASATVNVNRLLMWLADRGLGGPIFLAGVPAQLGGALRMNAGAFGDTMANWVESATVFSRGRIQEFLTSEMGLGYRTSTPLGHFCEIRMKTKRIEGIREKILEKIDERRQKQPLTLPNLGCVFKNPEGQSAGQLIDRCGLKGVRVGDAAVSDRHANFIVNLGKAGQSDVLRLIERIQRCVASMFGVDLELEIEVVK